MTTQEEDYMTPVEFEELMKAIDTFHETIYASDLLKREILEGHIKSLTIHSICIMALTTFNIYFFYILLSKGLL